MNDYEPSLACCMPSVLHLFGTVVEIGHSKSVLHPGFTTLFRKIERIITTSNVSILVSIYPVEIFLVSF
jgi:hypothetical protein